MIFRLAVALGALLFFPQIGFAQSFPELDGELSKQTINLFTLVGAISFVPAAVIMTTTFPFIIVCFSILRQAIGLQQSPPNMLLIGVALFLTYYVMDPIWQTSWRNGILPYLNNSLEIGDAFQRAAEPIRSFMALRTDPDTYFSFAQMRGVENISAENSPFSVLVPSFMLSEISRAFQVGFLIFLPFVVIDLVVSAILMSMGMMMVPPAIVSLPFKLGFFVISDGWRLFSLSLIQGYG